MKTELPENVTARFKNWVSTGISERSWSLRELGRKCGFSHAHLSNAMHGKKTVTWDLVANVANAFGEREETAFRKIGLLPNGITRMEELQDIFYRLPDEQRKSVVEYAETKLNS